MLEGGRAHRKKTLWVLQKQLRQCYLSSQLGLLGALPMSPPSMPDKCVCLLDSDYGCSECNMIRSNLSHRLRWESIGAYLNQPFVWHSTETWKHLMMDILNQTAGRHHFTRLDTFRIVIKSNGIPETSGYLLRWIAPIALYLTTFFILDGLSDFFFILLDFSLLYYFVYTTNILFLGC